MFDGLKKRAKNRYAKMKARHQQEKQTQKSYIIQQKKKNSNKAVTFIHSLFHFNRHGKLRRYAMNFGMSILAMIICYGWAWHNYEQYKVEQAKTLTSYKSSTSFSQTSGTTLKLRHVQIGTNRKTAYVPFSLSSMNDIPASAGKYSIYVGGALQKMKAHTMTGQMILFGPTTARGVILLHSIHRIPNKPIYVILRSNAKLSDAQIHSSGGSTQSTKGIGIFEHRYNALAFKINPDAKSTKVNPNLTTDDSISQLYAYLFGHKDEKQVFAADEKDRREIKIDVNKSREYVSRLKQLGFKMPVFKGKQGWGKGNHLPAFMNPKWRPYDYIMSNGVPHNKKGKVNPKNVREDAAYSPVNDNPDEEDNVQFPQVLKKPDGTTTDDSNSNEVQSGGNGGGSGSSSSDNINGGSVDDPSKIWQALQDVWTNVLDDKQQMYAINAATLFKIKATIEDMNQLSSRGSEKHFKQVN